MKVSERVRKSVKECERVNERDQQEPGRKKGNGQKELGEILK